jgi:hypothetical protein
MKRPAHYESLVVLLETPNQKERLNLVIKLALNLIKNGYVFEAHQAPNLTLVGFAYLAGPLLDNNILQFLHHR